MAVYWAKFSESAISKKKAEILYRHYVYDAISYTIKSVIVSWTWILSSYDHDIDMPNTSFPCNK